MSTIGTTNVDSLLPVLSTVAGEVEEINAQIARLQERKRLLIGTIRKAQAVINGIVSRESTILESPITELKLGTAVTHALRAINVQTLGDLTGKTEEDLKKTPTLCAACGEIRAALAEFGLTLKESPQLKLITSST